MDILFNEAIALAGILTPVIAILVQIVKTADVNPRWLPFISIGLGTATGLVFGVSAGADLFIYGLAGFLSGAGASGAYDATKALKGEDK